MKREYLQTNSIKMKHLLVLLILLFNMGMKSFADDVRLTMSAPNVVTLGEQFRLTLSLNAEGEDATLPDLSKFNVLMGPSVSQSRSVQWVNGSMSQSVNFSYTYILSANEEGTFTIAPASVKVKRSVVQSNSIQIQVIKGRQTSSANAQSGGGSAAAAANDGNAQKAAPISRDNLFIRLDVDKRNVYKGEMIIATLKLYSRVGGLSLVDQKLPSFEGFWTQDFELPPVEQTRTNEAVDGVIYNTYTLQKKVLIPQQEGTLTINPLTMDFNVQQRVNSNNVFDDFFGSYKNVRVTTASKPVTISVRSLPPAPSGFYGAVGSFNITSDIDKKTLASNEAATIKINITGTGNLKHINPMKLNFSPDFEVYDPKTNYNFKTSASGIVGNTSFEHLFIPRHAGDYVIPASDFVYFDPSSQSYKTLSTKEFRLHVTKGSEDQNATVMSSLSKEDVKFLGKDIKYIKINDEPLRPRKATFFGSILYYFCMIGALLIFAALVVFQRKRITQNANIALMRNKKASKIARKHLKAAAICVKNNNKDEFYDALLKAFWGYLSDKLTIPLSELSRDNAKSTLSNYTVGEKTINDFIEIIDVCEMAKFAPQTVPHSITEMYSQSELIIEDFERQIRKNK